MDLAWMFGTVSAFWGWLVPPDNQPMWNCTWDRAERAFSDGVIRLWVDKLALVSDSPQPAAGVWPAQTELAGARINLKIGNTTILTGFRKPFCEWWATAYERIRSAQGVHLPTGAKS